MNFPHISRFKTFPFIILFSAGLRDTLGSSSIEESRIPNSKLDIGVWYTVEMTKSYVPGYLIWKQHASKYLYHVFRVPDPSIYEKDGEEYESTLWEFIPSSEYPGWYKMQNRASPGNFVTWHKTTFLYSNELTKYLILESGRDEEDYLIKPVLLETEETAYGTSVHYHQLVMKKIPTGNITWTNGDSSSHYIQNDHRDGHPDVENYKKGGSWFDDTLFVFKPAEYSNGEKESSLSDVVVEADWLHVIKDFIEGYIETDN